MAQFTVHPPSGQPVTVEAPSQEAALDQVLSATGPDVSTLGSFGRGAVGMLPLGEQAYAGIAGLAEHKPYTQERQELTQEIQADKDTNPGARLAGQAAGVVLPTIATAGLAAPETLGGAALQGAGIGGLFGAGNAIDTLASGGSGARAAGDVALGAGVGAAGGVAAKTLGEFLGGLGKKGTLEGEAVSGIPHPSSAIETAPNAASESSMINGRGVSVPSGKMSGPTMSASAEAGGAEAHIPAGSPNPIISTGEAGGLPGNGYSETVNTPAASDSELRARQAIQMWGASPGQVRKLPGKDLAQTVNHMVDVAEANSTPENNLFALTDRYADRARKFQALHDKTGKAIGDMIEGAKVEPIPANQVADNVLKQSIKLPTAQQKADLQELAAQIKGYADPSGNLDFKRLHQLKGDIGETAFAGQGNDVKQGAYHVISNLQEAEMNKVGAINIPAFKNLKQTYEMTSRVTPMLRRATAKSLTGRPSLTELLSGHPIEALSKLGGERLEGIKNVVGFKVANALDKGNLGSVSPGVAGAGAAGAVPEKMPTDVLLNHPALAKYRRPFAQAAAQAKDAGEAQKSEAVTAFKLSQTDPHFVKAQEEARANPTAQEPKKMAEGGIVMSPDKSLLSRFKDNFSGPTRGFGSTLSGLETMAHKAAGEQPTFNPQMSDELKTYMEFMKQEREANAQ